MNQQRRIFRGRGGPTDRRLPKHNARRRRPPKPAAASNSTDEAAVAAVPTTKRDDSIEAIRNGVDVAPESAVYSEDIDSSSVEHSADGALEPIHGSSGSTSAPSWQEDEESSKRLIENNTTTTACQNEINHLLQRIRNNKTAIQTSKLAVNKPDTYQTNVLFAVQNCTTEWKSILRYYLYDPVTTKEEGMSSEMLLLCRTAGLALFELVQQALQCGPLAGSKPGYFARCGSDTALVVLEFLQELLPEEDSSMGTNSKHTNNNNNMFWSDKQVAIIAKWKQNAAKAVEKQKPASKSVQKKVQKANNHSNKKKGKKNG